MTKANTLDRAAVDVNVENHGGVITFTLNTDGARDWVEDNVHTESWQWLGRSLCVDYRYGDALRRGMEDDGLIVE